MSESRVPPVEAERNALMLRLHDDEGVSYGQLAERFQMSRARAHQIVTRERARQSKSYSR